MPFPRRGESFHAFSTATLNTPIPRTTRKSRNIHLNRIMNRSRNIVSFLLIDLTPERKGGSPGGDLVTHLVQRVKVRSQVHDSNQPALNRDRARGSLLRSTSSS